MALGSVAVAVLLTTACGVYRRHTYTFGDTGSSAMPPTVAGELPPGPAAPAAEVSRARSIAARSSALASLLGRGPSRFARSEVWPGDGSGALGVILVYRLGRPITVDDVVPYAQVPPDAPSSGDCRFPYTPGWERLKAARVTEVEARVDLRRGRLADVWTNAKSGTVSPVPGRPFPQCEEK